MAQWVKDAKHDDQSSICATHMMGGEKLLPLISMCAMTL